MSPTHGSELFLSKCALCNDSGRVCNKLLKFLSKTAFSYNLRWVSDVLNVIFVLVFCIKTGSFFLIFWGVGGVTDGGMGTLRDTGENDSKTKRNLANFNKSLAC